MDSDFFGEMPYQVGRLETRLAEAQSHIVELEEQLTTARTALERAGRCAACHGDGQTKYTERLCKDCNGLGMLFGGLSKEKALAAIETGETRPLQDIDGTPCDGNGRPIEER